MEKDRIEVRNPATSEKIAEIEVASAQEVIDALKRARDAQALWEKKDFSERATVLLQFRDLLIDRAEDVAQVLISETGKTQADVYGNELFYVCDAIGFWVKNAKKYLKLEKFRPHLMKTKRVESTYSTHGVVGIISPWNYPLVLTIGEAVPALMAGNAVIIKPSELTPLTARFTAGLGTEAGLPQNLLRVLVGYGETAEALIDHVDMVSFTGSVATGKKVLRRAAERLIPVSLELGGKDPMIVLRDANLERAANACVWGSLMNSGQTCTSIERVYVEEPIYDNFIQRVTGKVASLKQGGNSDTADLGSMSSEGQVMKVEAHIEDAVQKGARILTGGRRNTKLVGLYFEPTVIADVRHNMRIMKEETFGPVIAVMKVSDPEEAIRLANDSRYGLGSSVFTKDREKGRQVAEKIQAGAVCINDSLVNFVIPEAPMGGIKESGLGRRHGAEGIRKYCRQKTIVTDRLGLNSEFVWFPMTPKKVNLLRKGLRLLFRSGWKNKFSKVGD